MSTAGTVDAAFLETIARLGRLILARDPAVADEFEETAIVVGSDPGEVARGRSELVAFFATVRAWPAAITWEWSRIDHTIEGNLGWFFAEGWAVARGDGIETRTDYRLAGILSHDGTRWKWRLFSGSQPTA
jgi:hypothetical protein